MDSSTTVETATEQNLLRMEDTPNFSDGNHHRAISARQLAPGGTAKTTAPERLSPGCALVKTLSRIQQR
jgi:hypothetical protein